MSLVPTPATDEVDEYMVETRDASPSNFLIKIQPFSLLSENGISNYRSSVFLADGYKWAVTIVFGEHVSMYMSMVGVGMNFHHRKCNWEINAIFTFFIYNHISDNYLSFRGKAWRLHEFSCESGTCSLISKESLMDVSNGYIAKDSCVFGAEVFVIKPHKRVLECLYLQRSNPYKHELELKRFSKLGKIWKSKKFSDGANSWKVIVVCPRGEGSADSGFISIFLECVKCKREEEWHQKHKAKVGITLKNNHTSIHTTGNFDHWFAQWGPNGGFPKFMPIADMKDPTKGFLVKDSCFLEIEISTQARTFS